VIGRSVYVVSIFKMVTAKISTVSVIHVCHVDKGPIQLLHVKKVNGKF
jgi:hypothetical protein